MNAVSMNAVRAIVNGEPATFAAGTTISDVVAAVSAAGLGVGVALNADVVPRGLWANTEIATGDRIELLSAAPGG